MAAKTRGPVSRGALAKAIVDGIKKAQDDYEDMSGGLWVWEGAEYWITTYVARQLWKLIGPRSVIIEGASDQTLREARRRRGRKAGATKGKRYDIVVYFPSRDTPRAVVEIKLSGNKDAFLKDVTRVVAALKASRLRFGAVGYYFSYRSDSKDVKQKLREFADERCAVASDIAGKDGFRVVPKVYTSPVYTWDDEEEEHAWLAGCLVIERKPGNPLN